MTGVIFDIKRFAVHDGNGLRSTLFLKGCPLRCPWCQNPEGIDPRPVLWHNPQSCLHCGTCVCVCPRHALSLADRIHVNRNACNRCLACVDACPAAAMELQGNVLTARDAAQLLLRDRVFFGTDGGITLSGGEVLMQWQFAAQVLKLCKESNVDTAIETCLLASRQALEAVLPYVDHFIVDIKLMDGAKHRSLLGADNQLILKNYQWLVARNADILVRTPLIPGYTATDENIRNIAAYIAHIDPQANYELLNFNPLCRSKYSAMEKDYPVAGGALTREQMEHFYRIIAQEGIINIIKE